MRVGFAQESMFFETVSVEWQVPTASFLFESELMVGVRTAHAVGSPKVRNAFVYSSQN